MKGKLKAKAKRVLKKAAPAKKASGNKTKAPLKAKSKVAQGQKATVKRAKANTSPLVSEKHSEFNQKNSDPAHKYGHRKMNLKDELKEQAGQKVETKNHDALNSLTRGELAQRNTINMRRIIPGASIEKKGRLNTK